MPLSQALLPEFDHEMATTRKALERVPDDKWAWAPHTKSMKLGQLATHIAAAVNWAVPTIAQDALDLAPPGAPPMQPPVKNSTAEVLAMFDANVAGARAAIAGASDEHLFKNWSLLMGGKAAITMPRAAVLRTFVLSHVIHHRGQLSVYLRLLDVLVPSIYGPSADEGKLGG
jgi:uncharacterized damage-inducible protein DinB